MLLGLCSWSCVNSSGVTEFCLEGELDLGLRYQGMRPEAGEFYPTSWCVISEDDSERVMFSGAGRSNPDMDGNWTVAYLPPDLVRIVNRDAPPDIEFRGTNNRDEALRMRRMDPRRLLAEYRAHPEAFDGLQVELRGQRVHSVTSIAHLPLRGRVSVEWLWDWTDPEQPRLELILDDALLFKATGRWRSLPATQASSLWQATPGAEPVQVPGDNWPARINMRLITLADGVYLVRGVRTGFQHLVVHTGAGLVIGDAPAGWVEFHHLPPSELVPGLGISGLSERLVDFLHEHFSGIPIHAVALTHFHDDHAGGARAFAAEGAGIYATRESARFFDTVFNLDAMPADRLSEQGGRASVNAVAQPIVIGEPPNRVKLMPMGAGPHAYAMLGIWALDKDYFFVSDVHVPRSDADEPGAHRAVTECWFAAWAVEHLPGEVRVVNSHSDTVTPVSRLAAYLESELCKD